MPKTPTSPLDKTPSSHHRRPSNTSRRSGSSDKTETKTSTSSKAGKHGLKHSSGHVSTSKSITSPKPAVLNAVNAPMTPSAPAVDDVRSPKDLKRRVLESPSGSAPTPALASAAVDDASPHALPPAESRQTATGVMTPPTARKPSQGNLSEEVDRLREAVNAQLRLNQQRERLTKHLTEKQKMASEPTSSAVKSRVSPIREEGQFMHDSSSPSTSSLNTTSSESANTVRGAPTATATPSYPFPAMTTPRTSYTGLHRPFTALSPTVAPANSFTGMDTAIHDRLASGSVTPASTIAFQPTGAPRDEPNPDYPTPSLYDLTLMLSAEPGLAAWWTTVTQICQEWFKADRVSLALPADPTDVENVPWGQKATFSQASEDDELSMAYLGRGSSLIPSSSGTGDSFNNSENNNLGEQMLSPPLSRPGLLSRHSFTSFEESKKATPEHERPLRRLPLGRSKSYFSGTNERPPRAGTLMNADLNLEALEQHLAQEERNETGSWEVPSGPSRDVRARVFPQLQAFDLEADPLIDSAGVIKVLERGRLITLTRDYPYLDPPQTDSKPISKPQRPKPKPSSSRMSSFLGGEKGPHLKAQTGESSKKTASASHLHWYEDEIQPVSSPRYEEYEQAPPSPWSQSPAPSPAVRQDPNENPFFADANIDEESFNPSTTPQDYANVGQVEAIGIDRSWTVLHIPLYHVLLSKPIQSFRLDTAAMESRSAPRSKDKKKGGRKSPIEDVVPEKRTPIAILSILSPVIPYPSNLRHALDQLSPHLATSFSLCRHYTNLETTIAGLSRRRPQTSGFGAVAELGREGADPMEITSIPFLPADEGINTRSLSGSITSPSDYSAVSKSTTGSPAWESLGVSLDRRSGGGSPGLTVGDSYFSSKRRPGVSRTESSSQTGPNRRTSREGKDFPPMDARLQSRSSGEDNAPSSSRMSPITQDPDEETTTTIPTINPEVLAKLESVTLDDKDSGKTEVPRRQVKRAVSAQGPSHHDHTHTQLHSYGADFSATFQSLPVASAASGKHSTLPARSLIGPQDMPPPSDRLKGLMLDSLPAHVFVALPQTGEIVWVNSRYLSYRGTNVAELYQDPWASIHPDEREAYIKAWSHAIRTGEQFSMQVRIRRFDGKYRWFYTRAVGSRDTRGLIVQWYGSHMDIHDQHIAEVKAARQEEIEASEAKHRLLANLIPQIIFAATEDEGVTFANEQWLSFTGQTYEEALGLGFMDFVHPEDLAKCYVPLSQPLFASLKDLGKTADIDKAKAKSPLAAETGTETPPNPRQQASRTNSSTSSDQDAPPSDLADLAKRGIINVTTDGSGRPAYTTEMRLRSKTGEYRWHLVRCVAVDNINFGTGNGSWLCGCTDINDHKLLEAKLKEAMESKGKFLSNMSHEIRTPLIGISGMVNFLQDTVLNEEQTDYTNTIQTSATSLLAIINDILDLSKVDAGMMKLTYEWFHPASLIEDANELVSSMAIAKRLELNYIVEPDVPTWVKGDKVRIRQVLLNVIGNAIKFTSKGEVFSRCRVYRDPSVNVKENEIMLECSVMDTGRGFTEEEAELIFKPFSQIDGSSTRQHGGSGLGLVISRQLVELHGGKMNGKAVLNKGSTFTFTAKFGLPTEGDHPDASSLATSDPDPVLPVASLEVTARAMKQAGGNPLFAQRLAQTSPQTSPRLTESPHAVSSGSSNPSIMSAHSHITDRSSASSLNTGLIHFSEAARASGQDITGMKLSLPDKMPSDDTLTPESPDQRGSVSPNSKQFRPPMYSILIVCLQKYSLEATKQHIEMCLPKDIPHHLVGTCNVDEARSMLTGGDPALFTHILLNLPSPEELIAMIDLISGSTQLPETSIVILSDPVQRQAVLKLASEHDHIDLTTNRTSFVFKPIKPSKFVAVFNPSQERDNSLDRSRSNAQQVVANRKANYADVERKLGHKGHKVLLVEDNVVNQKVLLKFLGKAGIDVELALDGVECTEKVFAHSHSYYTIVLCDLHMPRKDGYQTCREIREWEKTEGYPAIPMIALSANVMADVLEKCVAAGFNSYVTKPVDFKELSKAMMDLLDASSK